MIRSRRFPAPSDALRLAALAVVVSLSGSLTGCSGSQPIAGGAAVSALSQAEDELSRGQFAAAERDATSALDAAEESTRVRARIVRARARLAQGEIAGARLDARLAEAALDMAFSDEDGARGIWHREVDGLFAAIRAREHVPVVVATAPLPPPAWTPPPTPAPVRTTGPQIEPRARWHARALRANHDPMTSIYRVTVHHTGTRFDSTDYGQSAQGVLSIQQYHQDGKKWADIGYHYLIDRAGRVWEGRPIGVQGAHAGNNQLNRGNIGVALLGDFEKQSVTTAQRQGLISLLDHLRGTYGIKSTEVHMHRELHGTECPGRALASIVDAYRSSGLARLDP